MQDNKVKVLANFHISLEYKDGSCSCFSETKRLWSDEKGKVTEDVIDKWETMFIKSILRTDYHVGKCGVVCTSFFKLDNAEE